MRQREIENDRISRMARSTDDRLPFLCECGRAGCFDLVWLSSNALAAHRNEGRPVLAHPVAADLAAV